MGTSFCTITAFSHWSTLARDRRRWSIPSLESCSTSQGMTTRVLDWNREYSGRAPSTRWPRVPEHPDQQLCPRAARRLRRVRWVSIPLRTGAGARADDDQGQSSQAGPTSPAHTPTPPCGQSLPMSHGPTSSNSCAISFLPLPQTTSMLTATAGRWLCRD